MLNVKKAYLVEFAVKVRVVADIPEIELTEEEEETLIGNMAIQKIRQHARDDNQYPYIENLAFIEEDIEVPYGSLDDEN